MSLVHVYPHSEKDLHNLENGVDCVCEPEVKNDGLDVNGDPAIVFVHQRLNKVIIDDLDKEVNCVCAKCGGEIHMTACPDHHWTISSECLNCNSVHIVSEKCKECDYPFRSYDINKSPRGA